MKKKITLLLVVLLTFIPVNASTIKDKKNELSSTQKDIESKQEAVNANKEKQTDIQEQIKQVDLKIVKIQENIKELGKQLEEKKNQIAESQVKLKEANVKKDEQYEATKARMVQMYKNQKIGYMQVIFSSGSFWDAMNRVEYVKRISQKDNNILDEYQLQIQTIEEQKRIIEEEKSELDTLQKAEIAKNNEMEQAKGEKESAFKRLAQEEINLQSEIEGLEAISANLKKEIQKLEEEAKKQAAAANKPSIPSQYVGGTFMWPVPGYYRVSSDYGPRTSPIFGKTEFHTGIDIPANHGVNVVAATDGVVITAGWIRGYGNTVMISHGGGLVTLYGHNSSLTISTGDSVKKGQVIAKIGSTGYSTGNHLHFEARLNGNHITPWKYLND